jgi:hypothetical protein
MMVRQALAQGRLTSNYLLWAIFEGFLPFDDTLHLVGYPVNVRHLVEGMIVLVGSGRKELGR